MKFIDTHLHFDSFEEAGETERILDAASQVGMLCAVAIGGSDAANRLAAEVAARHVERLRFTAGFDRDLAGQGVDWSVLDGWLAHPLCVGAGETGLDYHYEPEKAREQVALFEGMLDRAAKHQKPVVVHSREADDDTLGCLKSYVQVIDSGRENPGVLHCFTGGIPFARALLNLGFFISFSGITTFRNADSIREVAKYVPLDRMVVETDAPYLAPVPHRGKTNEPAFIPDIVRCVAHHRQIDPVVLAEETMRNAQRLFPGIASMCS